MGPIINHYFFDLHTHIALPYLGYERHYTYVTRSEEGRPERTFMVNSH